MSITKTTWIPNNKRDCINRLTRKNTKEDLARALADIHEQLWFRADDEEQHQRIVDVFDRILF